MDASLDLDAYLERIRFGGPLRRDLATLSALLQAHMAAIPFENLDVLLGRPIRLDLAALQAKLVQARRGGYCFEHATLFAAVLERIGLAPRRHAARVVLFVPREQAPRTHMFLTVELGGRRLVLDPGFGALAPRLPLPLVDGETVEIAGERFRMMRDGRDWRLHADAGDRSVDGWVSTVEDEYPVDFKLANHYTSTHPDSPFVGRLMLRALTADGRVGVMNREVTIRSGDAEHRVELADRSALRRLLAEHFGFDLPQVERMRVPAVDGWD